VSAALLHAALCLAPALVLAAALLLGRYPGEATLGRLRAARRRRALGAAPMVVAAVTSPAGAPRDPLADSAAGRAPPLLAVLG
jgi:hypothetical protein